MYVYEQATGRLSRDGKVIGQGYSGFGAGLNDPASQEIPNVGPIPCGLWQVGAPIDTAEHGPYVLRLTPDPATETFGRSGFLLHGDEIEHAGEHLASHGCIVMGRPARVLLWTSGDHALTVIARDLAAV